MPTLIKLASIVSVALLSACGGGSVAPPPPGDKVVTSFALQAGYHQRISQGFTTSYRVSGDCLGWATKKQEPPKPFETFDVNLSARPAEGFTLTIYSECRPATSQSAYVNHYDVNYQLLGHSLSLVDPSGNTTPVEYGVLSSVATPLPSVVKVGDSALFGTETIYTDSGKTAVVGYDFLSYVIETGAPSTSTAIVNLITERYDSLAKTHLIFKQQSRSRMAEDGTLTDMSIDLQAGTSHLVFTVP